MPDSKKVISFPSAPKPEPPADDQRIKLFEGSLTLYRRSDAKTDAWQYAIRLNDGSYERKSTKKADLEQAKKFATDRYYQIKWRTDHGLPVKAASFKEVAALYKTELQRERQQVPGKHTRTERKLRLLDRFLVPYFNDRPLVEIKQRHIQEFQSDYRAHWHEIRGGEERFGPFAPSANSDRFQEEVMSQLFELAVKQGLISPAERPLIERTKPTRTVRSHFRPNEQAVIFAHLQAAMTSSRCNGAQKRARALLYHYCRFLMITGMRPGKEPMSVRINEIEWREAEDPPVAILQVRDGKTGPHEVIVRIDEIKPIIDDITAMHRAPIGTNTRLFWIDGNELNPDRLSIMFHQVLVDLGMTHGPNGAPRSLYSWRHVAITNWLMDDQSLTFIKDNAATSIYHIESTYSHVLHQTRASELKKRRITTPWNEN